MAPTQPCPAHIPSSDMLRSVQHLETNCSFSHDSPLLSCLLPSAVSSDPCAKVLALHGNELTAHQHVCPISSPYGRSSDRTGQDCSTPRNAAVRGLKRAAASCRRLAPSFFHNTTRQQDDRKMDERYNTMEADRFKSTTLWLCDASCRLLLLEACLDRCVTGKYAVVHEHCCSC